ncbi:hypothetical protein Phi19:2_gp093 [Cellulophaga phage phi19:2]|uniref:Uncharacterized protein n=2 Tax=Cellulophaga phage phiST TaxID=756282 RepID=M4SPQ1_9CAUD|nr:hypothetical protein CGPG_00017 [Cellulophaga phage phiST]AGH56716.1 hypothetical protein CGPG_00017 [Cellulophaga phage phiST]AGO47232.1 hypothetical protein PhiST_gp093 [Cellulophaga phage phiST]AGO48728.1 hypothetical protein Phi19:2_gp093 [Cellulophaga phage phi19:2]
MMNPVYYYYYHPESQSLFASIEYLDDIELLELTKVQAISKKIELGLDQIEFV